ncbi:MAG: hypothetical protein LKJ75_02510 [Clostridia bacterium]|jgi:hypothetical protein|nr:hypothetical protein [Clostridia bacterium]MCI2014056.1 hypothetical protein [Clostridia bacterium]
MLKVKDEASIGKYKVLFLDGPIPLKPFTCVLVKGIKMKATMPYDLKNSIAIESNETFINENVEFC